MKTELPSGTTSPALTGATAANAASRSANRPSASRAVIGACLQWLGAVAGFLVSFFIAALILPLGKTLMEATPPTGILSTPAALLFSGAVNALILVWAGRRSALRGAGMWMQLLVLSFGAQVFMTQIETAYFISAFPLLHGNFEVYGIVARGLLSSLMFTLLVTWIVGGFSKKPRGQALYEVTADRAVKAGSWLAAIYVVLYLLFGYYVAWQSPELRHFYGGPSELNSLFAQWGQTFMDRPELAVFQYFRGALWMLCLIPLFKHYAGKRGELVILSALALGLLPTVELTFANPLMPAAVSARHFVEVSISTGIFGALCAWFVPRETQRAASS
ncbi:MAG: hypothetical protein ACM3QS_16890 [Bacteroidota bacterium]